MPFSATVTYDYVVEMHLLLYILIHSVIKQSILYHDNIYFFIIKYERLLRGTMHLQCNFIRLKNTLYCQLKTHFIGFY